MRLSLINVLKIKTYIYIILNIFPPLQVVGTVKINASSISLFQDIIFDVLWKEST